MPSRACPVCGTPTTASDGRCPRHPRARSAGRPDRGTAADRRLRAEVLERDGYRCRWCGVDLRDLIERERQVDHHPVAFADGGPTIAENLVAACGPCNRRRGGAQPRRRRRR
jgi:5-methylcytosine-specific restriction endonuclease McrA